MQFLKFEIIAHGYVDMAHTMYARGLSMHQNCSNYALTNLLFGLCRLI
jgi:hypothetical protein